MGLIELFIIAVGVSMDAFAVAICKGLSMKKVNIKKAGVVGLYFGAFQAIMPLAGYFLGVQFQEKITSIDHWIALILLGFIGIKMIRESRISKCEITNISLIKYSFNSFTKTYNFLTDRDYSLNFKNMSILAIATSIDALAIGVTLAFLKVNIASAVFFIGVITFTLSMIGVKLGNVFGVIYKSKAEFLGGLILIFMGIKIFLDHIGVISF
jgi:manganese efflux pump family protein